MTKLCATPLILYSPAYQTRRSKRIVKNTKENTLLKFSTLQCMVDHGKHIFIDEEKQVNDKILFYIIGNYVSFKNNGIRIKLSLQLCL